MPSAVCPHCNERAYSSAEFDRPWTCPTCGEIVIPDDPSLMDKVDAIIEQYTRFWLRDPQEAEVDTP